ncbi:MAG: hypothetical protein KTQ49_01315, partial [Candidatus Omnitrophica bacterium]|nr:hypothetical protein [Candidatus Omnitrophota bacterium]
FTLYAGYLILKSELDPKGLFREIQVLFARLLDQLAQSSREKRLLELCRDEELVRKLLNLELTRQDWKEVLEKKESLSMDALVGRLKEIGIEVSEEFGIPLTSFEMRPVNPVFRDAVHQAQKAAYAFYDAARRREDVFYEKISTVMRERSLDKAIVITGGFHTDGMTDLFREHEVNYGVLTPRLMERSDEQLYRTVMLQNKASLFELSYLEAALRSMPPGAYATQVGEEEFMNSLSALITAIGHVGGVGTSQAIEIFNQSKFAEDAGIRIEPTSARLNDKGRPVYEVTPRRFGVSKTGPVGRSEMRVTPTTAALGAIMVTTPMLAAVSQSAAQNAPQNNPAIHVSPYASSTIARTDTLTIITRKEFQKGLYKDKVPAEFLADTTAYRALEDAFKSRSTKAVQVTRSTEVTPGETIPGGVVFTPVDPMTAIINYFKFVSHEDIGVLSQLIGNQRPGAWVRDVYNLNPNNYTIEGIEAFVRSHPEILERFMPADMETITDLASELSELEIERILIAGFADVLPGTTDEKLRAAFEEIARANGTTPEEVRAIYNDHLNRVLISQLRAVIFAEFLRGLPGFENFTYVMEGLGTEGATQDETASEEERGVDRRVEVVVELAPEAEELPPTQSPEIVETSYNIGILERYRREALPWYLQIGGEYGTFSTGPGARNVLIGLNEFHQFYKGSGKDFKKTFPNYDKYSDFFTNDWNAGGLLSKPKTPGQEGLQNNLNKFGVDTLGGSGLQGLVWRLNAPRGKFTQGGGLTRYTRAITAPGIRQPQVTDKKGIPQKVKIGAKGGEDLGAKENISGGIEVGIGDVKINAGLNYGAQYNTAYGYRGVLNLDASGVNTNDAQVMFMNEVIESTRQFLYDFHLDNYWNAMDGSWENHPAGFFNGPYNANFKGGVGGFGNIQKGAVGSLEFTAPDGARIRVTIDREFAAGGRGQMDLNVYGTGRNFVDIVKVEYVDALGWNGRTARDWWGTMDYSALGPLKASSSMGYGDLDNAKMLSLDIPGGLSATFAIYGNTTEGAFNQVDLVARLLGQFVHDNLGKKFHGDVNVSGNAIWDGQGIAFDKGYNFDRGSWTNANTYERVPNYWSQRQAGTMVQLRYPFMVEEGNLSFGVTPYLQGSMEHFWKPDSAFKLTVYGGRNFDLGYGGAGRVTYDGNLLTASGAVYAGGQNGRWGLTGANVVLGFNIIPGVGIEGLDEAFMNVHGSTFSKADAVRAAQDMFRGLQGRYYGFLTLSAMTQDMQGLTLMNELMGVLPDYATGYLQLGKSFNNGRNIYLDVEGISQFMRHANSLMMRYGMGYNAPHWSFNVGLGRDWSTAFGLTIKFGKAGPSTRSPGRSEVRQAITESLTSEEMSAVKEMALGPDLGKLANAEKKGFSSRDVVNLVSAGFWALGSGLGAVLEAVKGLVSLAVRSVRDQFKALRPDAVMPMTDLPGFVVDVLDESPTASKINAIRAVLTGNSNQHHGILLSVAEGMSLQAVKASLREAIGSVSPEIRRRIHVDVFRAGNALVLKDKIQSLSAPVLKGQAFRTAGTAAAMETYVVTATSGVCVQLEDFRDVLPAALVERPSNVTTMDGEALDTAGTVMTTAFAQELLKGETLSEKTNQAIQRSGRRYQFNMEGLRALVSKILSEIQGLLSIQASA